jgi:hypothetical protein
MALIVAGAMLGAAAGATLGLAGGLTGAAIGAGIGTAAGLGVGALAYYWTRPGYIYGYYAPFHGYYLQPYFYPQYSYPVTYGYWRPSVPIWRY